jgi:hypothetical protein
MRASFDAAILALLALSALSRCLPYPRLPALPDSATFRRHRDRGVSRPAR